MSTPLVSAAGSDAPSYHVLLVEDTDALRNLVQKLFAKNFPNSTLYVVRDQKNALLAMRGKRFFPYESEGVVIPHFDMVLMDNGIFKKEVDPLKEEVPSPRSGLGIQAAKFMRGYFRARPEKTTQIVAFSSDPPEEFQIPFPFDHVLASKIFNVSSVKAWLEERNPV